MSIPGTAIEAIKLRLTTMSEWLASEGVAPILEGQSHLDRSTPESAYWHSGYHRAMSDVLRLLDASLSHADSEGISSDCLRASLDEGNCRVG